MFIDDKKEGRYIDKNKLNPSQNIKKHWAAHSEATFYLFLSIFIRFKLFPLYLQKIIQK